jgi:nucleotide-binding universal stress UspA family protein
MRHLLAIDIADSSRERAVDVAAAWVRRVGGTLDLVHAEGQRYAFEFVLDPAVRELMRKEANRLREHDLEHLQQLMQRVDEANRGEARCLEGRTVPALVEHATGYDHLVVATHGRVGMAHFWLGSIAEQLVRRASSPVVVLRIAKEG